MIKTIKFFLLIAGLTHIAGFVPLHGSIPRDERDALVILYTATDGDNWHQKDNWLKGDASNWHGVTVETINNEDHVTGLHLRGNNLSGPIPGELAHLSRLKYLYLDNNQLYLDNNQSAGVVPPGFGGLADLERLYLDHNNLSGTIPPGLGNLTSLKYLYLDNNRFSGEIPATLSNLTNLIVLSLGSNKLTGSIPTGLKQLWKLINLDIGYNALHTGDQNLRAFLAGITPGWESTQTTAPTGLSVTAQSNSTLEFKWTGIPFTSYGGGYEILSGTVRGGPYVSLGETGSKSDDSLVVAFNIIPGTTYYFAARTKTSPHEYNNNEVLSEYGAEITPGNIDLVMLTVQSMPGEGAVITLIPADTTGMDGGTTNFHGTYLRDTEVTLTAPGLLDGRGFRNWETDGTEYFTPTVRVTMDGNHTMTVFYKQPEIFFTAGRLNFAATTSGLVTPSREFLLSNRGGGTLDWTIAEPPSWLIVTPVSGSCSGYGSEFINVSVDPSGLDRGTYEDVITITAPEASNSPQTVTVSLTVKKKSADEPPFGQFLTPVPPPRGTGLSAAIPVTGWALDDIGIAGVKIYRGEDPDNLVYIGDAVLVAGARPDIMETYPGYPMNHKAGWGYMMLSNFLPGGGNGNFTLYALAVDGAGNEVTLGSKTITVNNDDAQKPFGAIDTPGQGGSASGNGYRNEGWVLTPPGQGGTKHEIPVDGSTITLYIDSIKVTEGAAYNIFRADIAGLFPGYENSEGALAYFVIDTTAYPNGIHTIHWIAEDSAGRTAGIGSRYFTVRNSSSSSRRSRRSGANGARSIDIARIPVDRHGPVYIKKGYNPAVEYQTLYPGNNGGIPVEIRELERLELRLSPAPAVYEGYQVVSTQLRSLPIGSTLDRARGIFYWQPGPGFFGGFDLVFIRKPGVTIPD